METINVARELINSNDYLASVDLSDAYFSIPILIVSKISTVYLERTTFRVCLSSIWV